MSMDRSMKASLDRYITGNYGEDQLDQLEELGGLTDCPVCGAPDILHEEFDRITEAMTNDDEFCTRCDLTFREVRQKGDEQ